MEESKKNIIMQKIIADQYEKSTSSYKVSQEIDFSIIRKELENIPIGERKEMIQRIIRSIKNIWIMTRITVNLIVKLYNRYASKK